VTEQELRALVRDAIARQGGTLAPTREAHIAPTRSSFALFVLPSGADDDGPCLIEPAVMCNHCGYCKSYGH
jgi:hypothetical protein